MESVSLCVAVFPNGNCISCCQQETNAMFLSRDPSHYLFSPCSIVVLDKVTGSQVVKKFPASYGNKRFNTPYTRAHHLSLSWAGSCPHIPLPES